MLTYSYLSDSLPCIVFRIWPIAHTSLLATSLQVFRLGTVRSFIGTMQPSRLAIASDSNRSTLGSVLMSDVMLGLLGSVQPGNVVTTFRDCRSY